MSLVLAAPAVTAQGALDPLAPLPPVEPLADPLDRSLPPVDDPLPHRLPETPTDAADDLVEEAEDLSPGTARDVQESLSEVTGTVDNTLGNAVSAASPGLQLAAGIVTRAFVEDVDPFGNAIESNVLLVLADSNQLAAIARASPELDVIARRELDALGLTQVTFRADSGFGLSQRALDLRRDYPDATIDFNHLYRLQDQPAVTRAGTTNADHDVAEPANGAAAALRIGLIDSAVDPAHRSLAGIDLERMDFVMHDGERPLGHGTAVASLLAEASGRQAGILSASVFFQAPGHAPGASTESLVAALDWLAGQQADAINMSLAGPPNALLQRAIEALAQGGGPVVVAAVGNNGPSGEPMYPGAYEAVVGVTAVDRERRAFRYANRGEHVDFAALGVDVRVADLRGGWRIESGTSMAAPRVAAMVARLGHEGKFVGEAVWKQLVAGAIDIGRPGFDPVFGHGLLEQPPAVASRTGTKRPD